LKKELIDVYNFSKLYSEVYGRKSEFDNAILPFLEIENDKDWIRKHFELTPTVAAITMLSKYQNDCYNIASIIMSDIKKKMTE
jgi:GldM N-terminal domain